MFKTSSLILIALAMLMLYIIPYTRSEMKKISGGVFVLVFKYVLTCFKVLYKDHLLILKNLLSSHKKIYPTLGNDKQVNKNV